MALIATKTKNIFILNTIHLFFSYCIPNRRDVLIRIFNDPDVYDIRWMAYMLATTYWESASVVTTNITRPASIQYFVDLTQTISQQGR